jgi:hypothetical protein
MRHLILICATAVLAACATTPAPAPAPAPKAEAPKAEAPKAEAAKPAEVKKAPQCWNGDASKFEDVGTKSSISGVMVECKPTSDGKAAQWVGGKH